MKKYHEKPTIYVDTVSINVMNLTNSVNFYKRVIGFQVLEQTSHQAILTADGKTPLLILEEPSDVIQKEKGTSGLYHFALLLPTRADLSRFLHHILALNIPLGASDHAVSEAIYVDDPDGSGIEVYRDRSSDEWEWAQGEVHMTTERLDGEGLLAESDAPWSGLPADTLMGHIHLHVSDLQQTEQFYTEGLNLDVVTRYPGALFMSSGGYHHHLGLNIWNGSGVPAPKENSVGLNWFTLVLADEEVRNQVIQQLKQLDAPITKQGEDYLTSDPSGNTIRLII